MDDYLTVNQVANALGLSRAGVMLLIHKKVIIAEKVANVFLIKPSELDKARNRPKRGRPWPKRSDK